MISTTSTYFTVTIGVSSNASCKDAATFYQIHQQEVDT